MIILLAFTTLINFNCILSKKLIYQILNLKQKSKKNKVNKVFKKIYINITHHIYLYYLEHILDYYYYLLC